MIPTTNRKHTAYMNLALFVLMNICVSTGFALFSTAFSVFMGWAPPPESRTITDATEYYNVLNAAMFLGLLMFGLGLKPVIRRFRRFMDDVQENNF